MGKKSATNGTVRIAEGREGKDEKGGEGKNVKTRVGEEETKIARFEKNEKTGFKYNAIAFYAYLEEKKKKKETEKKLTDHDRLRSTMTDRDRP